jgi:hypothetical protein
MVSELKINHINIFILGLNFFEVIPNWHMYFNAHKKIRLLYMVCDINSKKKHMDYYFSLHISCKLSYN